MLIGMSDGFETLTDAIGRIETFPCCAFEGDTNGFALDACSLFRKGGGLEVLEGLQACNAETIWSRAMALLAAHFPTL